jgi:ornithine decarboxylase
MRVPYFFSKDKLVQLSHDTPFFAFSDQVFLDTVRRYEVSLPEVEIFYAMKANANEYVLRCINEAGHGFEVASIYELAVLQALEVSAEKIIYGASVKPAAHIEQFAAYGVNCFAFDSKEELEKLAQHAPGARVYVRVLVDDSDSVFTMSSKFGTDTSSAVELLLMAAQLGLHAYGISFNVGSQARNHLAWANGIELVSRVIKELDERGLRIQMLNLGGGYPQSYLPGDGFADIEKIAETIQEAKALLPYNLQLVVEPGRGLVASSMVLVVSVIAKIKRPSGHWLFVDAGTYNALLEAMAYQGLTRYQVTPLVDESPNEAYEHFVLTGPTCDSIDTIDTDVVLPAKIKVGDRLVIHDTGAYSLVLASSFNGFPIPPVYEVRLS